MVIIAPPPMPWIARKQISAVMDVAVAHSSEPTTKRDTPSSCTKRREYWSERRPHSGVPAVFVSM
jgi:hypothetical protein